jgi:catechol 2,3-dioxygenase-like lactoylglutathione lyase family enzyme
MAFFGRKKPAPSGNKAADSISPGAEPFILGINWLGVKTNDVVRMAIFMEEVLGLPFIESGNSMAGHHVLYNCRNIRVELLEGGVTWAQHSKPRQGAPDIPLIPSFLVDEIKPIYGMLQEKEIPSTQLFDEGWVSSMLFFDPERNLWQITAVRNQPPVGTNQLDNLGVVWLAAEDLEAQVSFYRDVLGLPISENGGGARPLSGHTTPITETSEETLTEPESETAAGVGMGVVFFDKGTRLAISPGGVRIPEGAARLWGKDTAFQIGFKGQNVKALAEKLSAKGVKISSVGQNTAFGHWFNFTDPEGNQWRITEK